MKEYSPKEIEKKWQNIWENEGVFHAENEKAKEKVYLLVEFPYPSGEGLHVGHPRPYTALDIVARKRRLEGYNVLYPMGWDAFGLPTENYAIKNKIHPKIVTENNIKRFKSQLISLGLSFDWSREINTTDPKYYKWTQWIFIKLYEKGLAYKGEATINWCPDCKVGLSNEEVVNGACERCGTEVTRKVKTQWMLKITEYAERLIKDLDLVDYINRAKTQQVNWIGKSEGMEVKFSLKDKDEELKVFTTRADTIYGVTYMVISPEHPLIDKYRDEIKNMKEILEYREYSSKKSDFERTELAKDKTGVEIDGLKVINPLSNEEISLWISDYVLMTYGTGAVMAVPGHDSRDWEFAKKFNLPIREVISGGDIQKEAYLDTENGTIVNSELINGLDVKEAQEKISKYIEEKNLGEHKTNYKLRDWVFSRQRYWGEPIPMVHCETCGWVPIPEEQLPLELPEVESYEATDTGESPLSSMTDWIETECPKCGGEGRRETDTMPQWAGSSWYYLRYTDPKNDTELASRENLDYWLPVDWYNGGMEHTTLHLLYSRFWHKFLYDYGVISSPEPYLKRTSHGMILGENNEKMSKSKGNVINPDAVVDEFGADTLRTYEMFIGDFEKSASWSEDGVKGCRRFLERVWRLQDILVDGETYSEKLEVLINKTIKKVSADFENMKFNTAIAALMELINEINSIGQINREELKTFLILLNPVAPHMTEEMWKNIGYGGMLNETEWEKWDESKLIEDNLEIPVQINGKVRSTITILQDAPENEVREIVFTDEKISEVVKDKNIVKEIYVPNKIYNIVVK